MPKANHGQSMLSGLVDSDSDDQLVHPGTMPTPDSAAENKVPARRGRAKPKAAAPAKVTKTRAPARRASSRPDTRAKPAVTAPKGGRKALTDKTNQGGTDTEDIDDLDQNEDVEMEDAEDASVVAVKETKTKATRKAPAGRSKTTQETATNTGHDAEEGASNASALSVYAAKEKVASKRQAKSLPSPEKIIMETQLPVIDVDEEITQTSSRIALSAARRQSLSRVRQPSVQHRRAGSASDTERSDPTLRRKLGEITKKYENLNVKYQDLREIGLKEAERNFERLKKQTEEKSTASDKLIASLKAEIASQSSLTKESRGLKKKVESQLEEMGKLKAQVEQLKASLDEAQTQNKTLSTKLSANRGTAVSGDNTSSKPQGSNIGVNGGQAAQLKEDLYSDLTGLIVRGVKREAGDDTFDCIQTGRNGTLHFKLTAVNEKATESYEEAHCQYIPQLDPSRDKALMEILPDYLVDEISFPRPQAAKFYARVVKALTEKLE